MTLLRLHRVRTEVMKYYKYTQQKLYSNTLHLSTFIENAYNYLLLLQRLTVRYYSYRQ